ncbi:MAG TPA: hypothetical protein VGG16_17025 [Streptosporangiaceae bacterium]|jgi:predicted lipoprotein with Yx(FWY)xxD motif
MRKSGWAAAAGGLVAAALLLTACGGGSSSSANAGSGGSTPSTGAAATNTPNPASSGNQSSPPPGAVYFDVSHSKAGWVMAEGSGDLVYTYAADSAGKPSTCTGSCATTWVPVKGTGLISPVDHAFPAQFGVVAGQITYNGMPLYIYKGEAPYADHSGGQWKTISLSHSLVMNS